MIHPIVQYEWTRVLRSGRTWAALLGLTALLAVLVWLRWPGQDGASGAQAQQVLAVVAYGLLAAVTLVAPALGVVSVQRDRRAGTPALWLGLPYAARTIWCGKFVAVWAAVLLLPALSLPLAAASYVMGGISVADQLLPVYGLLALWALECVAWGMWKGLRSADVGAACRSAYLTVVLLTVATVGANLLLRNLQLGDAPVLVLDWLRCLSVFTAVEAVLAQPGAGGAGAGGAHLVLRFVGLTVGVVALLTVLAQWHWNNWMLDQPRRDKAARSTAFFRRAMLLWIFDPQRRGGLTPPWLNPVLVREFRRRRPDFPVWALPMWLTCLLGGPILIFFTNPVYTSLVGDISQVRVLGAAMVILQMALLGLAVPALSVGLFSGESESAGGQLWRLAPLSVWKRVAGKLGGQIGKLILLLLALVPGYVMLVILHPREQKLLAPLAVTMALSAVFFLLLGAVASAFFRRTADAMLAAYGIIAALCAGTLVFCFGQGTVFSPDLVRKVLLVNPLAAALELLQTPGFADYHLRPGVWWFLGLAGGAALAALVVRVWTGSRPQGAGPR